MLLSEQKRWKIEEDLLGEEGDQPEAEEDPRPDGQQDKPEPQEDVDLNITSN